MLTFNLQRVKALFVRELYLGFLPILKASSIVILIIFVGNLIASIVERQEGAHQSLPQGYNLVDISIPFGIILLIGGFIYASIAFKEFNKLPTRAEYLALPGSSLEKLTAKWFVTNPLFIFTISMLFFICIVILRPFIEKFGDVSFTNDIFFSRSYWNLVGIYFVLHSIFFFGSIAFNRAAIIKTLVALILIALVVALVNGLWFRIVWADMFDSLFQFKEITNGNREFGVHHNSPEEMWQVRFWQFAFKYLLAPVLWTASLFKLSEKEV